MRLLSFVNLASGATTTQGPFDTELTKPLRLGELHRVLSGCADEDAHAFTATNVLPPVAEFGAAQRATCSWSRISR